MPFRGGVTIRCLAGHQRREVDADVVGDDAVLLAVFQVLVEVGRVQQRFRGDAAAEEAGAAAVPSGSRSTTAIFRPSWAARMAATYPPGPLPMTVTSNSLAAQALPPLGNRPKLSGTTRGDKAAEAQRSGLGAGPEGRSALC